MITDEEKEWFLWYKNAVIILSLLYIVKYLRDFLNFQKQHIVALHQFQNWLISTA
jgi:hypothetical protein